MLAVTIAQLEAIDSAVNAANMIAVVPISCVLLAGADQVSVGSGGRVRRPCPGISGNQRYASALCPSFDR
ncbi:hypothetical protein MUBE_02020 [Mycobacterium uberis]|uniref:PE domain-containing protein n=1 Tax=Mycobacterium uberis TaxID=2162698 RepID=A0A3E1HM47_9MYCO|nr:hypothetical protein MUBE_02020 [Mycobacterium uberis]